MPRGKRRLISSSQMKVESLPPPSPKQQCCVVCYSDFTPYLNTSEKWESNMIKMFYNVLDIPSMGSSGEDGDDEESVISLPFCPACHSKISVMTSLQSQLQNIQAQFSTVRNDVAFTIVETIVKNCRNGPMDFIRQQIYDKWKGKYDMAKGSGDLNSPQGLEKLAAEGLMRNAHTSYFDNRSPRPGHQAMSRKDNQQYQAHPGSVNHSPPNGIVNLPTANSHNSHSAQPPQNQNQSSKRPPRAATMGYSKYLLLSQTTSLAQIRRMEKRAIRESISHDMPKLTPIRDSFQNMSQQAQQQALLAAKGQSGSAEQQVIQKRPPGRPFGSSRGGIRGMGSSMRGGMNQGPVPGKRRTSLGKRGYLEQPSGESEVPLKLPKVQTTKSILRGLKNEEPVQIKLKPGRRPRAVQPKIEEGSLQSSAMEFPGGSASGAFNADGILNNTDMAPPMKQRRRRGSLPTPKALEAIDDGSLNFTCTLCPKQYNNISRLRRHESLCHPGTKALQCSVCHNGFSSMLAYRRHMQNQHNRSLKGTTTRTCPFCKKSFVKEAAYHYHVSKHREPKPNAKGGRRPRAELVTIKLEATGQPPLPEAMDPLHIEGWEDLGIGATLGNEPNDVNHDQSLVIADMAGEEDGVVDGEESAEPPVAVVKKPKKPFKIFLGRKRRRRRNLKKEAAAAAAAAAGDTLLDGSEANPIPKPPEKVRKVPYKPRPRVVPINSPPVRKSMRRAEAVAVKADEAKEVEGQRGYYCSVCVKHFADYDLLTAHSLTHSEPEGQTHSCKECNQTFHNSEDLKSHAQSKHPSKPFIVEDARPNPITLNEEIPKTGAGSTSAESHEPNNPKIDLSPAGGGINPVPETQPVAENEKNTTSTPTKDEISPIIVNVVSLSSPGITSTTSTTTTGSSTLNTKPEIHVENTTLSVPKVDAVPVVSESAPISLPKASNGIGIVVAKGEIPPASHQNQNQTVPEGMNANPLPSGVDV